MMKSRSTLISKTCKTANILWLSGVLLIAQFTMPDQGFGKIFIDINSPSMQKIKIAIPDFKDFSDPEEKPELSGTLVEVLANDLDLSGYFISMDKKSFLDEDGPLLTSNNIRFKNWSVIGAELLIKGGYTCIGQYLKLEIRIYDVFYGRQIFAKQFLEKTDQYRNLMHRIGNEIVFNLTGYEGMFLSKFAFVNTSTGHKEVYICDFDGYNVKQITFDKSIALFPRWSPDGNYLVYNSYKEGDPMLYLIDMSSGKISRISARDGLNTGARWASDGKELVLTLSHESNPDIYGIDLNGKITKHYVNNWGIDVSPSLSPDGKKMAFVSNRSGSPQIYIKDLINGNEERLTFEVKYCTSPVWSRMDKIAFSAMTDGSIDIYTINPDGSNMRKLTESGGNSEDPCWSPDGRYLVFSSSRDGKYGLYIMNSNGQNQRKIGFMDGEETAPSWSPF